MQDNIDVLFTLIADKLRQLRVDDSDADWNAMSEALEASEFDTAIQAKLTAPISSPAPEADWNILENQLDEIDFDAVVGDKLAAATIPASEDDWSAFESDLDDLGIDTIFREKLERASVPVAAADWNVFEAELDELSFDALLRDKLEAANVPAGEAGWALLSSQLGEGFDRAMANKLGGAIVPGESEWPVMEDQLEAPTETLLVEKINSYSHPYDKKAWRKFLPMLNAAMPRPNFPWRSLAAAAILLLLAGSAGFFVSKGNLFDVNQEPGAGDPGQGNAPVAEIQAPASRNSQKPNTSGSRTTTGPRLEDDKQKVAPTDKQYNPDASLLAQDTPAENTGGIVSNPAPEVSVSYIQKKTNQDKPLAKDRMVTLPEQQLGIASDNPAARNFGNAGQREFELFSSTEDGATAIPNVEADIPAPNLAAELNPLKKIFFDKKAREKSFNGNLQIGWTHALLNSNTRLSDPGKPGYLSGIQLNIPLSPRLQLVTGVMYGEKSVSREMQNVFTPPALGNNVRAGEPEVWRSLLEADFTVIEIPVMLRYPLTPADQKLSLALQGGFSGILIIDAQYRHFDPQSPLNVNAPENTALTALKAEKEMQRGGASWGNFRFAPVIGYRLSRRVLFEAAPYLQFGQQRTGNKQLKLHSAGGTASILIELGKKQSN